MKIMSRLKMMLMFLDPVDEDVEHLDMVDKVEGLPIIQSILQELVDNFNCNVCAHCEGAFFFEAKLIVISDKILIKYDQNNRTIQLKILRRREEMEMPRWFFILNQ